MRSSYIEKPFAEANGLFPRRPKRIPQYRYQVGTKRKRWDDGALMTHTESEAVGRSAFETDGAGGQNGRFCLFSYNRVWVGSGELLTGNHTIIDPVVNQQ